MGLGRKEKINNTHREETKKPRVGKIDTLEQINLPRKIE